MRIAVLLDHWHADGGGLEQYLGQVLPLLVQRGHGVMLAARGASRGTPEGVSAKDLRRGRLLPRPWADWQEAREALRVARNWGAEVQWGLRAIPCPGALWQPMGGSGPEVQQARGRPPNLRTRALLRLEAETLQAAACVIPMSPMVERQIARRAPGKPQFLLPLPLLQQPTLLRQPGPRMRGQVASEPLRVLHCGRDPLRHGAAQAVQWFRRLKLKSVHARLDLWAKTIAHAERAIGKSARALEAEDVLLHPWDGGFRSALDHADLLFHPTLYDSFSLVCLEAAAAGVPVVTTVAAGVAELLPPELCTTVPREAAEEAAEHAMELLLSGGSVGSEQWSELVQGVRWEFRLEQHVRQLESVLETLLRS